MQVTNSETRLPMQIKIVSVCPVWYFAPANFIYDFAMSLQARGIGKRAALVPGLIGISISAHSAQAPTGPPKFEVAPIKPARPLTSPGVVAGSRFDRVASTGPRGLGSGSHQDRVWFRRVPHLWRTIVDCFRPLGHGRDASTEDSTRTNPAAAAIALM